MSKRFTESSKWNDVWFMELNVDQKVVWLYLLDNCDHAGVYSPNPRLMTFQSGVGMSKDEVFSFMAGRLIELKSGKWFLPTFIKYQYGKLTRSNSAHLGVIRVLEREGIDLSEYEVDCEDGAARCRIGKTTRKEILIRDNMTCHYCKEHGTFETLVVDHIIPRAKGGSNDDSNLVCACVKCNTATSDKDYDTFKALKAPFNDLSGAQDQDKDKDKVQDKDKDLVLVAPDQPEIPLAKQTPTQADAIWALYPKKSGKKEAFPEINAAIKAHGFEKIREAVAAYAAAVATWQTADHVYIPDPVRWFKRGKYDDDRSTWQRGTVAPTYREPKLRIE